MNGQRFWITKYACTTGVYVLDGCEVHNSKYAYSARGTRSEFHVIGLDAFRSEVEAIANAVLKVQKRIASLDKNRADLENKLADLLEKHRGLK